MIILTAYLSVLTLVALTGFYKIYKHITSPYTLYRKYKVKSFKNMVDKTKFPIIEVHINGVKVHALIDTGSDDNVISNKVINKTDAKKVKLCTTGSIGSAYPVKLNLLIDGDEFNNETFFVSDTVSKSFNVLSKHYNLNLVAILGARFFKEHRWTIDFEKLEILR